MLFRSKVKMAKEETTDLDAIVRRLSKSLFDAETHRERLRILWEDWGFRLPMATAVLTVLWPEFFTVYDVRACEELDGHHDLAAWSGFDRIWSGYVQFRDAVMAAEPEGASLRDKDRYLWGRSSARQLEKDIARRFTKPSEPAQ